MLCSNCGADNPKSAKFCIDCASPFPRRCPSCGSENLPRAKFCAQCAALLGASNRTAAPVVPSIPPDYNLNVALSEGKGNGPLDGERRTVTALFADIQG